MSPSGQCQYHSSITAVRLTAGMPVIISQVFYSLNQDLLKFLVSETTCEQDHRFQPPSSLPLKFVVRQLTAYPVQQQPAFKNVPQLPTTIAVCYF